MNSVLVKFCGLEGADPRERGLTEGRIALYLADLCTLHAQHWTVMLLVGNAVYYVLQYVRGRGPHFGPGGEINL